VGASRSGRSCKEVGSKVQNNSSGRIYARPILEQTKRSSGSDKGHDSVTSPSNSFLPQVRFLGYAGW